MSRLPAHDCWFLTGPTASGKTSIGLLLAQRLEAEIVSLDSMALYRGMDIGTAKPTAEEQTAVPHHLIDVIGPQQEFSLAQYVEAAHRCIEQIQARGRQVLFIGGTPLYLKGLLRGVFEGPPADWELRHTLRDQAEREGPVALHRQLAQVDPESADRLHPNDTRRVIRAIEVYEKTGQPISELQKQFDQGLPAEACRVFVLDWPRPKLYERIDRRVEQMFAEGLVDEVRGLLDLSEPLSRTARQAVGYREVIDHLAEKHSKNRAVELVQTHTRQLAKRQCTWFRSLSECRIVPMSEGLDAEDLAKQITKAGDQVV